MITDAQDSGIDFLQRPNCKHQHSSFVKFIFRFARSSFQPFGFFFLAFSMVDAVDGTDNLSNQILFSDHSSYAKSKLYQISDKLTDKISALQAVSMNLKTDQKVSFLIFCKLYNQFHVSYFLPQIINKLGAEIESLHQDEENLSLHIDRTEIWSENLGNWAAVIHTIQVCLCPNLQFISFIFLEELSGISISSIRKFSKMTSWFRISSSLFI